MLKKLIPAVIVMLIVTGCNDVEDLLTFHFSDRTQIRIESASPLNLPIEIITPAITSNWLIRLQEKSFTRIRQERRTANTVLSIRRTASTSQLSPNRELIPCAQARRFLRNLGSERTFIRGQLISH